MRLLSIGQVARHSGVSVETVRFYERQGLIEKPRRKESGYRQFPEAVIGRLRVLRRARELGFSLPEIREMFDLGAGGEVPCGEVRRRAEARIDEIDERVRDLEKMRLALEEVVRVCEEKNPAGPCPFLEALEAQEEGVM